MKRVLNCYEYILRDDKNNVSFCCCCRGYVLSCYNAWQWVHNVLTLLFFFLSFKYQIKAVLHERKPKMKTALSWLVDWCIELFTMLKFTNYHSDYCQILKNCLGSRCVVNREEVPTTKKKTTGPNFECPPSFGKNLKIIRKKKVKNIVNVKNTEYR